APVNAPASVFEYRGTEYLAVLAAGTFYSGSVRGDGLWLFSLKGTLEEAAPLMTAPAAAVAPAEVAPPAGVPNLSQGKEIYVRNCEPCHGPDGQGSHGEGAPLKATLTTAFVYSTATAGRKAMPPFRGVLSPTELRDV